MTNPRFILAAALIALAGAANADCSLRQVFPPALPSLESSSFASVEALGPRVRSYIDAEQSRLERCRETTDAGVFNLRLAQLKLFARNYNELVRFYNRVAADLYAANAPLNPGG